MFVWLKLLDNMTNVCKDRWYTFLISWDVSLVIQSPLFKNIAFVDILNVLMSRKDVHFLFHIIITLHGTKNVMKWFEKILLFNCFNFCVIQQNTMTVVLGHFHQASTERFKHAATGSQVSSICITALIASKLKSLNDWNSDFVDAILLAGDGLHLSILRKRVGHSVELNPD